MWESLRINNFRGIKDLSLEPLRGVNLLVGPNNIGKTSVLEAAFLLSGHSNPTLPLALSALRGRGQVRADPMDIWGWLLPGKNPNATSILETKENGEKKSLRLRLTLPEVVSQPLESQEPISSLAAQGALPLVLQLEYTSGDDKSGIKRMSGKLVKAGIEYTGGENRVKNTTYLLPSRFPTADEDAKLLDDLVRMKKKAVLIKWLQRLDPRIADVATQKVTNASEIIVDIGFQEFMPIAFAGEGVARFLAVLLRASMLEQGLLLLDEVELGLHYSDFPTLWRTLFEVAEEGTGLQIIATSHSWESLRAAHESAQERSSYNLGVFRLEQTSAGEVGCVALSEQDVEFGLRAGMEIR
jgi:hypothetical protein